MAFMEPRWASANPRILDQTSAAGALPASTISAFSRFCSTSMVVAMDGGSFEVRFLGLVEFAKSGMVAKMAGPELPEMPKPGGGRNFGFWVFMSPP